MKKIVNPVSPFDAPDPFMTYDHDTKYYYALFTRGNRLELFRSRYAASIITDNDSKVIYTINGEKDGIFGDIWAPEMHKGTNGKWYVYTSGRKQKEPGPKRLFIVESEGGDPFGEWHFKSMPTPDVFSIDPTVYTAPDGKQYVCYSRVDPVYGQVLDVCDMENPYTFGQKIATVAKAELEWETVAPYIGKRAIVEGGFFLEKNSRLFLIYSANGCWSDHYCIGVLEHTGGDICDASNWIKHPRPLFVYGNGVFGPGHASFFQSPDKSEVWCAYHGMKNHNATVTYAPRYFNIQKVDFDENGYPVMGLPAGYETELEPPSGEID